MRWRSPLRSRTPRRRSTGDARSTPASVLILQTEENDVVRTYQLAPDGAVTPIDEPPANAPIVSFSDQDRRLTVPADASRRAVRRTVDRAFAEATRMVRPKHDAVVFATPEKRLLTLTNSVIPGIAVLHELLKTRTPAELPAVVGFALGAGDEFLLVQFVLDERGQLDRIQCLPRIPQATLARALRSFASLNKVALKGHDRQELAPEQTLLFEAADLRAALARVRAYPRTGDWHGIPLPILQGLGQGAIVLACGAAMGWSGWQYWQSTQGGERLEAQQAALATAQRAIQDIAHQHFDAFTALASVDPIPAVARAQTLAVPGGHVDIDVDRQRGVTLTAHVPLGDDPVHLAMPIAPAAPCVRRDVNVTSTLNELQVTYGCAPHPADIALGGLFSARR